MGDDRNLQIILDQLETIILFLQRPVVRSQVVALVVILLVAWLLSDVLWYLVIRRRSKWAIRRFFRKGRRRYWRLGIVSLQYLPFPVLGLSLMQLAIALFQAQSWLATLLVRSLGLFQLFLGYRLLIVLLYLLIGRRYARPYHYRILAPTFIIIILGQVVGLGIALRALGQVILFNMFGQTTTLGELFWAIVTLYILFTLAWAAQKTFEIFILPRTTVQPGAVAVTLTIGRYVVLSLGLLIVLGALGFDITSLAVIGGGLGIGIGFGLQNIVSNFISGIVLLFEQSLRPGDIIEVDGTLGTVEKLSIRATIVRTFDNIEKTIPNETLFTSTVTNLTKSSRVIRAIMTIGVGYDSDPEEVMEVLRQVATDHELVMEDPAPLVHFMEYGESSIDFRLAVWLDTSYRLQVSSELRSTIWKEFEKRGIKIPFPQRDLHIRSGLPDPEFKVADAQPEMAVPKS